MQIVGLLTTLFPLSLDRQLVLRFSVTLMIQIFSTISILTGILSLVIYPYITAPWPPMLLCISAISQVLVVLQLSLVVDDANFGRHNSPV